MARAKIVRRKDIRECGKNNLPLCDVLVGGFPCQDLSVAGKRAGLFGERSRLFFEFVRIASELRPVWLVIENVPRLLSSDSGRDFAIVLLSLENAGYRCAWRVLDSQFFGVAQSRRRLFIVGHADVRRAGAVLFEEVLIRERSAAPETGSAARFGAAKSAAILGAGADGAAPDRILRA